MQFNHSTFSTAVYGISITFLLSPFFVLPVKKAGASDPPPVFNS
jgi:hypothetical protein